MLRLTFAVENANISWNFVAHQIDIQALNTYGKRLELRIINSTGKKQLTYIISLLLLLSMIRLMNFALHGALPDLLLFTWPRTTTFNSPLFLPWNQNKFQPMSSRPTSAPGPDGIDYLILKVLPNGIKLLLFKLLSEIVNSGSFLKEWHKFSVFFIPKKESDKFRPISLAQCTLKLADSS